MKGSWGQIAGAKTGGLLPDSVRRTRHKVIAGGSRSPGGCAGAPPSSPVSWSSRADVLAHMALPKEHWPQFHRLVRSNG